MTPPSATQHLAVNISGRQELKLIVTQAGDGPSYDHADWAGARLVLAPGQGTGLTGKYYGDMSLTTYRLTRTDAAVNFDWGGGSPDPSITADLFSARWTGMVVPRYAETYTFYTTTDDGVRLWIDGQLIIDKWVDQAPT